MKELFDAWTKQAPQEKEHQFKIMATKAAVIVIIAILSAWLAYAHVVCGEAVIGLFGTLFGY